MLSHPVGRQIHAALLALPEGLGEAVGLAEHQLHAVMVHQDTGERERGGERHAGGDQRKKTPAWYQRDRWSSHQGRGYCLSQRVVYSQTEGSGVRIPLSAVYLLWESFSKMPNLNFQMHYVA